MIRTGVAGMTTAGIVAGITIADTIAGMGTIATMITIGITIAGMGTIATMITIGITAADIDWVACKQAPATSKFLHGNPPGAMRRAFSCMVGLRSRSGRTCRRFRHRRAHVFLAHAVAEQPGRNVAHDAELQQEPQQRRNPRRRAGLLQRA